MGLFDSHYREIKDYLSRKRVEGKLKVFRHEGKTCWPVSRNRNLVLGQDTAVELGNPRDASTSFLLWPDNPSEIKHGRITLVGPDLQRLNGKHASFGKIVMIAGVDFNEDNCCDRYREMEHVRYDIHLQGYMMRGVSQYQREWSRISREAIDNGFDFQVLGGALIDKISKLAYVRAAEVIFITAGRKEVLEIKAIADGVVKIMGAMNKMATELKLDCDACEYSDVCDEVAELRSMRKTFRDKESIANA
jgi:CO dehydrogenase/acetyl-CoA synthase beta subunit